jgi:excisionase family DNA binding protein
VPPRALPIPDAAAYLGVSRRKVYRFMGQGVLCPVRLPGCRRTLLDRHDLDALVERSKARPPDGTGRGA